MYKFLYVLTFFIWRIFYPLKIVNKKNWVKKTPYVVVSNHLSNIDPIYINAYFFERKKFLAKKELFKNKFVGKILKIAGGIPIDRNKIDFSAIKESLAALKNSQKLVVFPEGTRNKEDETLQEIKNGAAMLAIKAKVMLLPVHIEKRAKIFRRNKLIVGDAFSLEEFFDKKLDADTLNAAGKIIEEKLLDLQNQNK